MSSAKLTPLSIDIRPLNGESYKSIATLCWKDIPAFAILTGKNGSGKTQLLEVLAHHFTGTVPRDLPRNASLPVEVEVTGASYTPDEIGYVPNTGRFSGGVATSLVQLPELRQMALQRAQQLHSYRHNIEETALAYKINKLFGDDIHNVTPEKFDDMIKDKFELIVDSVDVTKSITHLFLDHRLKILEALERGTPGFDLNGKPLEPTPWKVVNDSLTAAGFPYELVSPEQTRLMDRYNLVLKDRLTGNEVAATDLSSGEKVILQLVLWIFTATKDGLFPKMLLLDEPDAHLHPSMTTQFLDVISEVLVNRYGVRVIMTTHSPSTVALAPEGSIFRIERGAPAIAPVEKRPDIIALLTAGLVTVSRATKFCFVEDEDDVAFYEAVYEILTDYGPSQDQMALRTSPSIAFIPASIGKGTTKIAGGSTVVAKWVDKLDAEPLDRMFFGIIDRDIDSADSARVHPIGRYSYENYLLDPLIVFALLLEEGTAPLVPNLAISPGDEHLLRGRDETTLQAIVDVVCGIMTSTDARLETAGTKEVTYSVGRSVQMPGWVIDHRGHDLLPIAQRAFGGPAVINPLRLRKALRRCRLIPEELANLLATIQKT